MSFGVRTLPLAFSLLVFAAGSLSAQGTGTQVRIVGFGFCDGDGSGTDGAANVPQASVSCSAPRARATGTATAVDGRIGTFGGVVADQLDKDDALTDRGPGTAGVLSQASWQDVITFQGSVIPKYFTMTAGLHGVLDALRGDTGPSSASATLAMSLTANGISQSVFESVAAVGSQDSDPIEETIVGPFTPLVVDAPILGSGSSSLVIFQLFLSTQASFISSSGIARPALLSEAAFNNTAYIESIAFFDENHKDITTDVSYTFKNGTLLGEGLPTTATPEPSSLLLTGTAVAGFAITRRRKRVAASA